jgi:hypothetical protein
VKVHIDTEEFGTGTIRIYLYDRLPDGKTVVLEGQELLNKRVAPEGEAIKPALTLPWMIGQDILKALAEALDQHGVKTDSDAKIAGTLEATRYHLEDLRRLLKMGKP